MTFGTGLNWRPSVAGRTIAIDVNDEYTAFMHRLDAGQVTEDEAAEVFDRLIADVHELRAWMPCP